MNTPLPGWLRCLGFCFSLLFLSVGLGAQTPAPADPDAPAVFDGDATALMLARQYLEGGAKSRPAVLEALTRMGWSVRNAKDAVLQAPPANANTGLAMRDYELEELLWNPTEQPTVRFISVAQALAVPFEDADPEELAQDLVETIRKSAESDQPQQRFWARFIVALGRVSPANYDLLAPAPASVIPLSKAETKALEKAVRKNPFAAMSAAAQPRPVWPDDDPVLKPSPKPQRADDDTRESSADRDQKRMNEISQEMGKISADFGSKDAAKQKAAQARMVKLQTEMGAIAQRMQQGAMKQAQAAMQKFQNASEGKDDKESDDSGPRFTAEWRDQPLSMLQIALITRVLSADIRKAAQAGRVGHAALTPQRWLQPLPVAALGFAQAQSGGPTSFGDQFGGAVGDIWATGWGAYTGAVLDHHLPDNKFSKAAGIANTMIAWFKTIMTVARQKIKVEVENVPLVRTKTRAAGEQRTARCTVEIDFPKSDTLKAIRAAGNLTTIDLQMPDGGPVSGAKVVWRLPEGSYNGKYQTKGGGSEYRPDLAVVQFAQGAGYTSMTDDNGVATITIEGAPQRRDLPKTVRAYPRRAAVSVEVTIKVGNLTQDLNDAINTAMGGVINGTLGFIADMVLRTSFFFQAGKNFEVTDWKEPAWEGEFEITVKGSGSKHQKGEKGGPDSDIAWNLNRYMIGRLHTPDWEEENEEAKQYDNDGRHKLEVDSDTRAFKLTDSSSQKSKNTNNRYTADGPLQIPSPSAAGLTYPSRAEPSGSATLMFNGGMMTLDINAFFGAECLVTRSEQSKGKSNNKAGPEYLSLLGGIYPDTFTITEPNDGTSDSIEGTKTIEARGNLPYVPTFDVKLEIKYRLWKNGPPPKNKAR